MIETEIVIANASLMFVSLLLVMGCCINIFVKAIFCIGSDFEQSIWQRIARITFWLGMGGFGSALVTICFEKIGQFPNDFMIMVFDLILSFSALWMTFTSLSCLSVKRVAWIIGKIIAYLVLYWAMRYVSTIILQKRLVLGENWIWQLTTILLYYFLVEKAVFVLSNKITEWNRVNRENGKIFSGSGKISGSM